MPYVLELWLKDIPPYTIEFGRWIIVLAVTTQLSIGIMSAIQAGGDIGKYQLTMSLMILSNIPLSVVLLSLGCPPYSVMIGCVAVEVITLFVRLLFAKRLVNYNVTYFLVHVVFRGLIPTLMAAFAGYIIVMFFEQSFIRFLFVIIICVIVFVVSSWFIALNNDERDIFRNIFRKVELKIKKNR